MNLIGEIAYFRVFRPPPLGALGVHCTITTCGSHLQLQRVVALRVEQSNKWNATDAAEGVIKILVLA